MELFAKQQKNAEYKLTRINTEMLVLHCKYLDFCADFCLKIARIFTKLSSDEELVTLYQDRGENE